MAVLELLVLATFGALPWPGAATLQERTITFSAKAARLARLLPDLSKEAGLTLTASSRTANDVVILSFKDVPLSSVLGKIAEVTGAKWETSKDGQILVRTEAMQREQEKADLETRAAEIARAIKKLAEPVEKETFDAKAADRLLLELKGLDERSKDTESRIAGMRDTWRLFSRAPANRALIRLLMTLDTKDLAALPPQHAGVWSTRPNALQRPFPRPVDKVAKALMQEQAVWADALRRSPADSGRMMMGGDPRFFGTEDLESAPAKLVLSAMCFSELGSFSFNLHAYDGQGKLLLAIDTQMQSERTEAILGSNVTMPSTGDFQLSQRSLDFIRLTSPQRDDFVRPEVTPEWTKTFTRPDLEDLLSFGVSEALIERAKREGLDLAGCLSDRISSFNYAAAVNGKVDLNWYMADIPNRADVRIERGQGWLTIRPSRPARARQLNADRLALGKLAEGLRQRGYNSLDELADYAAKFEQESMWPQVGAYLSALGSGSERLLQFSDWKMLRFFGLLGPVQKATLRRGEALACASLNAEAKVALSEIVYFDTSERNRIRLLEDPRQSNEIPRDFYPERTEALPMGFPDRLVLRASEVVEPGVVVATKGDGRVTPWTYVHTVREVGALLVYPRTIKPESAFRPAELQTVKLTFEFEGKTAMVGELKETRADFRKAGVPLANLPEPMRIEIEKAIAQAKAGGRPPAHPLTPSNPPPVH